MREHVLAALETWKAGGQEKLASTDHDPLIAAMIRNGIAHLTADAELLERLAEQTPPSPSSPR